MSILESVWVALVLIIISIILATDPKTSNIDISNNVLANNLESQKFVRNLSWILVVIFYFLTIFVSYSI